MTSQEVTGETLWKFYSYEECEQQYGNEVAGKKD